MNGTKLKTKYLDEIYFMVPVLDVTEVVTTLRATLLAE
jgi:hypothetical protein